MNKRLVKKYALLGKDVPVADKFTENIRNVIKKPIYQYILFGIMMCIVGYLATELKVLPYSWQSAVCGYLIFSVH